MGLRKGHCYTKVERPYTRKSKVKSKSYIKTIPPNKIAKFIMGDIAAFNQRKFNFVCSLVPKDAIQIRDTAIEAARQIIYRGLENKLRGDYCFFVTAYPHHILRENKMLSGAGADRMQTGMQLSFGKPIGVAAQIDQKKPIFTVYCKKENVSFVRSTLKKAKRKLPGQKQIIVQEISS